MATTDSEQKEKVKRGGSAEPQMVSDTGPPPQAVSMETAQEQVGAWLCCTHFALHFVLSQKPQTMVGAERPATATDPVTPAPKIAGTAVALVQEKQLVTPAMAGGGREQVSWSRKKKVYTHVFVAMVNCVI